MRIQATDILLTLADNGQSAADPANSTDFAEVLQSLPASVESPVVEPAIRATPASPTAITATKPAPEAITPAQQSLLPAINSAAATPVTSGSASEEASLQVPATASDPLPAHDAPPAMLTRVTAASIATTDMPLPQNTPQVEPASVSLVPALDYTRQQIHKAREAVSEVSADPSAEDEEETDRLTPAPAPDLASTSLPRVLVEPAYGVPVIVIQSQAASPALADSTVRVTREPATSSRQPTPRSALTTVAAPGKPSMAEHTPVETVAWQSQAALTTSGETAPRSGKRLPLQDTGVTAETRSVLQSTPHTADAAEQEPFDQDLLQSVAVALESNPHSRPVHAGFQATVTSTPATIGNSSLSLQASLPSDSNYPTPTPAALSPIASPIQDQSVGSGLRLAQADSAPQLYASYWPATDEFNHDLVHQVRWLKDHDLQRAELQLHPADLGRLSIHIGLQDGQASVQLITHTPEARQLLEQALPQLQQLLAQNGMKLGDSQVSQDSRGSNERFPAAGNPHFFNDSITGEQEPLQPALFRRSVGTHRIDHYV